MTPRLCVLLSVLAACDAVALDDDVAGDATELAGPGVVTSPRHGAVLARGPVVVEGLAPAGAALAIERWDAGAGAWVTAAAHTPGSDVGAGPRRFSIDVVLDDDAWPAGGLVHLRVRADGEPLPFFDAEAAPCRPAQPRWAGRVDGCASRARAISLVDRDSQPPREVTLLDAGGEGGTDAMLAHYREIDAPATLADFVRRFGLDGADTVRMTYYNAGQLGVARDVHCRGIAGGEGGGVACYVLKYRGETPEAALERAVDARSRAAARASFTADGGMALFQLPGRAPGYLVYDGRGRLTSDVQLDTEGGAMLRGRSCANCHNAGGLLFDADAIAFADRDGHRRADQEDAMRRLNAMMVASSPPAVTALVRGWYGGGEALVGAQRGDFVPAGWAADAAVYRQVIAPYCQTCHLGHPDADLSLASAGSMAALADDIAARVCGDGGPRSLVMPNAEIPLRGFWQGPARAYLAGAIGAERMGACTP